MMKARMGKRRFGMMMQTMGPMMSQMMEGGGPGSMMGGSGFGGMGGGNIMGMLGGAGGGDMMSMVPQLMRMANVGGRPPALSAAALVSRVRTRRRGYPAPDRPSAPIA
jgi:hypothetical protein